MKKAARQIQAKAAAAAVAATGSKKGPAAASKKAAAATVPAAKKKGTTSRVADVPLPPSSSPTAAAGVGVGGRNRNVLHASDKLEAPKGITAGQPLKFLLSATTVGLIGESLEDACAQINNKNKNSRNSNKKKTLVFDRKLFEQLGTSGLDQLELKDRARHLAIVMEVLLRDAIEGNATGKQRNKPLEKKTDLQGDVAAAKTALLPSKPGGSNSKKKKKKEEVQGTEGATAAAGKIDLRILADVAETMISVVVQSLGPTSAERLEKNSQEKSTATTAAGKKKKKMNYTEEEKEENDGDDKSGGSFGLNAFFFMPHGELLHNLGRAERGIDVKLLLHANKELTKRFTAEFSIRVLVEREEKKVLSELKTWAKDGNVDVRRLVSEGTRPRLPWGSHLPKYKQDPSPILPLLELLKQDKALYVRRSVANSVGDIAKDNFQVALELCQGWVEAARKEKSLDRAKELRWVVRHALRNRIKNGCKKSITLCEWAPK